MGKLNDIRQSLLAGSTTKEFVDQGYAKSSVFNEARKLKHTKPDDINASSVTDELQDLRHRKEIIKLQKEIAELEAGKEKLPERIATLESKVAKLQSLLNNAVDTALSICLKEVGWNDEEAEEYADGWVGKNIKG
ncbi:hypothetical protein ACFLV5_04745 [Chloroflexota bacterium]